MYAISWDSPRTPKAWITVAGYKFKAIVDSGATINVIDSDTFAYLNNVKLLHKIFLGNLKPLSKQRKNALWEQFM